MNRFKKAVAITLLASFAIASAPQKIFAGKDEWKITTVERSFGQTYVLESTTKQIGAKPLSFMAEAFGSGNFVNVDDANDSYVDSYSLASSNPEIAPELFLVVTHWLRIDPAIVTVCSGEGEYLDPNSSGTKNEAKPYLAKYKLSHTDFNEEEGFNCIKTGSMNTLRDNATLTSFLAGLTLKPETKDAITTIIKYSSNGNNRFLPVWERGDPEPAIVDKCKDKFILPQLDTEEKATKFLNDFKQDLSNDAITLPTLNADVLNVQIGDRAEAFASIGKIIKNIKPGDLVARDKNMYQKFYRQGASLRYPNVSLSGDINYELTSMINSAEIPKVDDFPGVDKQAVVFDAVAISLVAIASTAGTGNPLIAMRQAVIWGTVISGARTSINYMLEFAKNESMINSLLDITMAQTYILKNNEFNACMSENGSNWAVVNDKLVSDAQSRLSQFNVTFGSSGYGSPIGNACGSVPTSVGIAMLQAFCNLGLALASLADFLITKSFQVLTDVLYGTHTANTSTPVGTGATSGSDAPANSTPTPTGVSGRAH